MAEIKNTFLKSKMNKDLDDRLIPNGEYRDAQNISVGKSEDADVGALENIIGNSTITEELPIGYANFGEIIGYFSDSTNNRIITFVTNYKDPNPSSPTYLSIANTYSPSGDFPLAGNYKSHICVYDQDNPGYVIVVSGDFLNFSTTNKVLGVSLIEDLLFFTDNRNQPRKININLALSNSNYYTTEDTISVAKYSPYEAISLLKKVTKKTTSAAVGSSTINVEDTDGIEDGMFVVAKNVDNVNAIEGSDFVTVDSTTATTVNLVTQEGATTVPVAYNADISDNGIVTFLKSTMTKEDPATGWPGDPDLLESRYVRFSYRFKFDDGENSIMAPFTQIAYVPKKKGYFRDGDEDASYRSTILEFMENEMNNMELLIPLPSKGVNLEQEYKITNLEILYKESDALTVKVLETLPISSIPSSELQTNIYSYQYQSRKPYKTLPEFETTRVYDKVPVRALSQETSGNRVMYGNFYDRYSSPNSIDYYVGAFSKETVNFDSWVEYPNHTVKQNRNYQVGFILADKFGRQTPVILSPVDLTSLDTGSSDFVGGSTIYNQYYDGSTQPVIRNWFGDAIKVVVQNKISNGVNDTNNLTQAGLYAIQYQDSAASGIGFSISSSSLNSSQDQLTFNLDSNNPDNTSIPRVGDYLRGEYRDYVKVTSVTGTISYTATADGSISKSYLHKDNLTNDIKFAYIINQVGWYSYKVVVKQTEQDYYNCYLPGILDGYPDHTGTSPYPSNEDGKTAHVVLLNDNINKIPRDLSEVGPDQKQYRSSVQLFGRVENNSGTSNTQYFPGSSTDTASTIATANDLNMNFTEVASVDNFYQLDTNPLIARISTLQQSIGVTEADMLPFLAVYETEPVNSLLDIFWETTTTGLISDLNEDILTGSDAPVGLTAINFEFNENQNPNGLGNTTGAADSPWITDYFYPLSPEGAQLIDTGQPNLTVTDNTPNTLDFFDIYQEQTTGDPNFGAYRVKINNNYLTYFSNSFNITDTYNFSLSIVDSDSNAITFDFTGSLTNIQPFLSSTTPPTLTPSPQVLPLLTTPFYEALDPNASFSIGNVGLPANGSLSLSNFGTQTAAFLESVPPPYTFFGMPYSTILINSQNGNISWGGLKLEGYYESQVKVKDALTSYQTTGGISSQGVESAGTLTSIIYDQPIRVVPAACNLSTSCQVSDIIGGQRSQVFNQGNNNESSFGWRFGSPLGGLPPGFVATQSNVQSVSFDGLQSGTVLFDLMVQASKTSGLNCKALFRWRIWKRANSGSTWTTMGVVSTNSVDLNSDNGNVGLGAGWIAPAQSTRFTCTNINLGTNSQIHIPIALTQKAEYFIECRGYRIGTGVAECWINAGDANYPTCVPVKGINLISGTGRDADYFQYTAALFSSTTAPNSCAAALSETVYTRTPYTHVVEQFFSDTALTTGQLIGSSQTDYTAYGYAPDASTTNGSDIASIYNAKVISVVDDPNDGRTRRGFIEPFSGSGIGSTKRQPCLTSGTYQDLRYRVYYNEDY